MSTSPTPIVITGIGLLTAAGLSTDATWAAVCEGKSFLAPIKAWDLHDWPCHLGGELPDFNPMHYLPDRKLLKAISRHDSFGLAAAEQAVQQSGVLPYRETLADPALFNERTGIFVGSPGNKYTQQHDFLKLISQHGGDLQAFGENIASEVHPMWLLRILPNNVLAYTGISYQFKGPNHNITNHAVGGMQALIEAYHALQSRQIDRALVIAYDLGIDPQALFYYHKLGLLSNTDLTPFSRNHSGTVLADGAVALLIETKASARERQAPCIAEITGGATRTENAGLFGLEPEAASLTALLQHLLQQQAISQADLAFIVAHGNGNALSDYSEARAFMHCLADQALPITAFKWSIGHTLVASGLIDCALAALALHHRRLPGIANLTQSIAPELNLQQHCRPFTQGNTALVINRGFASMNACIAMKACDA